MDTVQYVNTILEWSTYCHYLNILKQNSVKREQIWGNKQDMDRESWEFLPIWKGALLPWYKIKQP